MQVHYCHDENAIGCRPIKQRIGEPRNDDPTNATTEWAANVGKVLHSRVGLLDQRDEILAEITSLRLVMRRGLDKLRSGLLVKLDSSHRSFERASLMTWSAAMPVA